MSDKPKQFIDVENALIEHLVRMEALVARLTEDLHTAHTRTELLVERVTKYMGLLSKAFAEADTYFQRIAHAAEVIAEDSAPTRPFRESEKDTIIPGDQR